MRMLELGARAHMVPLCANMYLLLLYEAAALGPSSEFTH